jgi:hypothetical protein
LPLFFSSLFLVCAHTHIHFFSFFSSTSLSTIPKPFAHLFAMNTNLNFK